MYYVGVMGQPRKTVNLWSPMAMLEPYIDSYFYVVLSYVTANISSRKYYVIKYVSRLSGVGNGVVLLLFQRTCL